MRVSLFLFLLLFSAMVSPAFCDLSDTDLKEIRLIIKEEIEPVKKDVAVMQGKLEGIDERFDTIQDNFDRQNNIIIACIGIPMALLVIGATVWGILAHIRSRKEDTLQNQIETLTQEIETLKQQRIHP